MKCGWSSRHLILASPSGCALRYATALATGMESSSFPKVPMKASATRACESFYALLPEDELEVRPSPTTGNQFVAGWCRDAKLSQSWWIASRSEEHTSELQ